MQVVVTKSFPRAGADLSGPFLDRVTGVGDILAEAVRSVAAKAYDGEESGGEQ